MFILVSTPNSPLSSHGHKLLIVAPVIEGLLGGWSTLQSATTAYISDCTSAGSRAHVFSRFTGVFYLGFSMGPAIGGWIIRKRIGALPGQEKSVTAVFWLAILCSFANFLLVMFVFPESLSKEKKALAAEHYRQEHSVKGKGRALIVETESIDGQGNDPSHTPQGKPGVFGRFFSPLALFLPVTITDTTGRSRQDYSLTLLAGALFSYFLATVSALLS